jgi:hypothetical protein
VQIWHREHDDSDLAPVEIQKLIFPKKGNLALASIFGEKLHMPFFVHNT